MAKFLGRFRHSLDGKGRVAVPARFRSALPPEANNKFIGIVSDDGLEKCITLIPSHEYDDHVREIAALSRWHPDGRRLKRLIGSGTLDFEMDTQGRITIPSETVKALGLRKELLFVGSFEVVEIWEPVAYRIYLENGEGASQLESRLLDFKKPSSGES